METLKFKTTINCAGCLAKVTPLLNGLLDPEEWSVDITVPDKILTVRSGEVTAGEVEALVTKAGFRAEPID